MHAVRVAGEHELDAVLPAGTCERAFRFQAVRALVLVSERVGRRKIVCASVSGDAPASTLAARAAPSS